MWNSLRIWSWMSISWGWCRYFCVHTLRWLFRGRILSVNQIEEGPWIVRYCAQDGFHTALVAKLPTPLTTRTLPLGDIATSFPLLAAEWNGLDVTFPLRRIFRSFTEENALRLRDLRQYFLFRGILKSKVNIDTLTLIRDDTLEMITYDNPDAMLVFVAPDPGPGSPPA